eukprot:1071614-Pyramimonas_sp.AAC.1
MAFTSPLAAVASVAARRSGCATGQPRRAAPRRPRRHGGRARGCYTRVCDWTHRGVMSLLRLF